MFKLFKQKDLGLKRNFVIALIVAVIAIFTIIIPTVTDTVDQLKKIEPSIVKSITIDFIIFTLMFLLVKYFIHKNKVEEKDLRTTFESNESTLFKVAYFPSVEILATAADESSYNDIHVVFIGKGKGFFGTITEDTPCLLYCDEEGKGTNFFMANGAISCGHFCTGAIA